MNDLKLKKGIENGKNEQRKKINGRLYLFMQDRSENDKRNGQQQESNEQPKME